MGVNGNNTGRWADLHGTGITYTEQQVTTDYWTDDAYVYSLFKDHNTPYTLC